MGCDFVGLTCGPWCPLFVCVSCNLVRRVIRVASKRIEILKQQLEPAVQAVGMELWGIEFLSQGKHSVLRIYIESESGVSVDDCEAASHQISGILDVEDPIPGEYHLEVSSPGLDRPLFTFDQFSRYVGEFIRVRLQIAVEGKRNFTGRLLNAAENELLTFDAEDKQLTVSVNQIDKANLVPKFD